MAARSLLRYLAPKGPRPPKKPAIDDFYNYTAAELLEQYLPSYGHRYDTIIVDEGQDFHEAWWLVLEKLFRHARNPSWYIFYDPQQNLKRRELQFPVPQELEIVLDENLRNTQRIATYAFRVGQVNEARSSKRSPLGHPPQEIFYRDPRQMRDELRKLLHRLTHEEGLSTDQVMIVGQNQFANTPFSPTPGEGETAAYAEAV